GNTAIINLDTVNGASGYEGFFSAFGVSSKALKDLEGINVLVTLYQNGDETVKEINVPFEIVSHEGEEPGDGDDNGDDEENGETPGKDEDGNNDNDDNKGPADDNNNDSDKNKGTNNDDGTEGDKKDKDDAHLERSEEHTSELQSRIDLVCR